MTTIQTILKKNDLTRKDLFTGDLKVYSPVNGTELASLQEHSKADVEHVIKAAEKAFLEWRAIPAPVRGEFVRLLGDELRAAKENLGQLVTIECGKILSEGLGEVQEMIDICDFAVGLSRQLYGLTIASERPEHTMREVWHPLGPVGIITAFNFPVAVWAWNVALALVCGNPVIWKPSEKTPLTALACEKIVKKAAKRFQQAGHDVPANLIQVIIGGREVGEALVEHESVPLISATGSTKMGQAVAKKVAARLGRSLLELGGNNAMIVTPSADIDMAIRAITFGAVGTAGQRCTSLRRLIVHENIKDDLLKRLITIYKSLKIGDPLSKQNLIGPLIDEEAFNAMQDAIKLAETQGGKVICGGPRVTKAIKGGFYAEPAIIEMPRQSSIVKQETFAPILYVMTYKIMEDAMEMQNGVPQGLSSCIFTNDIREAERFLSATGSDCGIANVNIGPSGAEIGGAFGGEKETGGGRESGSDSWKSYMRRQTQTVNYSRELPLAQGVKFDV